MPPWLPDVFYRYPSCQTEEESSPGACGNAKEVFTRRCLNSKSLETPERGESRGGGASIIDAGEGVRPDRLGIHRGILPDIGFGVFRYHTDTHGSTNSTSPESQPQASRDDIDLCVICCTNEHIAIGRNVGTPCGSCRSVAYERMGRIIKHHYRNRTPNGNRTRCGAPADMDIISSLALATTSTSPLALTTVAFPIQASVVLDTIATSAPGVTAAEPGNTLLPRYAQVVVIISGSNENRLVGTRAGVVIVYLSSIGCIGQCGSCEDMNRAANIDRNTARRFPAYPGTFDVVLVTAVTASPLIKVVCGVATLSSTEGIGTSRQRRECCVVTRCASR